MVQIHKYFEEKGLEEKRKYKNEPPVIANSLTFKLWQEYFDYPNQGNIKREVSKEEMEMMKGKMDEFERAMKGGIIEMQSGEEAEFIIKESFLSADDPCYCGSGKKVIDCCIPPEKFKELLKHK